jgi:hypothetical protein
LGGFGPRKRLAVLVGIRGICAHIEH